MISISEVRIKLVASNAERLLAFCSITIDDGFCVRDLKVIEGSNGVFVAMPSRRITDRCHSCGHKNDLLSRYCSDCGHALRLGRASRDAHGKLKLYSDVAHPCCQKARDVITTAVLNELSAERERSKAPGYVNTYDDPYEAPLSYGQVVGNNHAHGLPDVEGRHDA